MSKETQARQKLAIPRFNSLFRRGEFAQFYLISEFDFDPAMEKDYKVIGLDGHHFENVAPKDVVWEVLRVRSNRSRKEMRISRAPTADEYIYRLTYRGDHAKWQLNPGHYVLRIYGEQKSIISETTFFIPWSEAEKKIEEFESMMDHHKINPEYREFLLTHHDRLMEEVSAGARKKFGHDRANAEFLESTFEIAIRVVNKKIVEQKKENAEKKGWGEDQLVAWTVDAAQDALGIQVHTLELLEKVFELAKDRVYDDNELESLVSTLVRGTDLRNYDEFGILQVIINNARHREIDDMRKQGSDAAGTWKYEETRRQTDGYQSNSEGIEFKVPEGTTEKFDEGYRKLSEKKKRQITPQLVLSINNENDGSQERIDLLIDETWIIGRQTSEELKRFGPWTRPVIDPDNRRVILAGYHHNTFSKNLIAIVPTYKYPEFMELGRTVSLMNPSDNFSISLGNRINLAPGASYATPNHLFFYYQVSPEAIRLSDSQKEKLKITAEQEQMRFQIRIDVFFESMDFREDVEILYAEHEWVGKDAVSVFEHTLQTMRPA